MRSSASTTRPSGSSPARSPAMPRRPYAAPNRYGVIAGDVAGFPNGRRLADDVIDIAERVAAGVLVPGFDNAPANQLGDGVDANDVPYLPYFPYVAPPHNPLHNTHYVQT